MYPRNLITILTCSVLLCAISGHLAAQEPATAPLTKFAADPLVAAERPAIEIYLVPEKDAHRAPGYSPEGLYVPLGEIQELALAAMRQSELERLSLGVQVRQLQINGILEPGRMRLAGELRYESFSDGWAAVPINMTSFPWTRQHSADGRAFMANVGGRTFLYVHGRTSGVLALESEIPFSMTESELSVVLGLFMVPTRIDLKWHDSQLPAMLEIVKANCIHRLDRTNGSPTATLWPSRHEPVVVELKRVTPVDSAAGWMLLHTVSIRARDSAAGATVNINDSLVLQGRFSAGGSLLLDIPAGMETSEFRSPDAVKLAIEGAQLRITPERGLDVIRIDADYIAMTENGTLNLSPWRTEAAAEFHEINLIDSQDRIVVLSPVPGALRPRPADGAAAGRVGDSERWATQYICDTPLPELPVALLPKQPLKPPRIKGALTITQGVADASFTIGFTDRIRSEADFELPEGWNLISLQALDSTGQPLPLTLFQEDARHWKLHAQSNAVLGSFKVQIRRLGNWSSVEETDFPFPILNVGGERPIEYEVSASWSEALNVRVSAIQAMIQVASEPPQMPANQQQQRTEVNAGNRGDRAKSIGLKVVGAEPSATLSVRRREPDLQAQVYTVLSVEPDRAIVRSRIEWTVRHAPASTFQFLLPAGTGENVRIDADDLRESNREVVEAGELWTLVTQNAVSGTWRVLLEWPLEPGAGGTLRAPQIGVPGVTSSEGFLVLEGAESLRLNMETTNLVEVDISELPTDPWGAKSRRLAAWQYIAPPYGLEVLGDAFESADPLDGLVREARLTTTVTPEGYRLTRAEYLVARTADRQFFEIVLPANATVWSVLVNERGEKPARRDLGGVVQLLAPLPVGSAAEEDNRISVLYLELGPALSEISHLTLDAPEVTIPVIRTFWDLNLPAGFEYLSYSARHADTYNVHTPLVTYLSEASYSENLIFLDVPLPVVIVGTAMAIIGLFVALVLWRQVRNRMAARRIQAESAQPEAKPKSENTIITRLTELFIVGFIMAVLAAIAVPNFLEAQSRAKVSRVRSDLRTMATAIEAYYVDNNAYPADVSVLWQGPVKYLADGFTDPFTVEDNRKIARSGYNYAQGRAAMEMAVAAGMADPQLLNTRDSSQGYWVTWAVGPDGRDDGGQIQYDPTNGTTSSGDVIRFSQGSSFDTRFGARGSGQAVTGSLRHYEASVSQQLSERNDRDGDLDAVMGPEGMTRTEDESRPQAGGQGGGAGQSVDGALGAEPAGEPMDDAGQFTMAPTIPDLPSPVIGDVPGSAEGNRFVLEDAFNSDSFVSDGFGSDGGILWSYEIDGTQLYSVNDSAPLSSNGWTGGRFQGDFIGNGRDLAGGFGFQSVEAGLLSLDIEIPEGGVQHRFEILGPETEVTIKLMNERNFLSMRFLVWFAVWLGLILAYLRSPRLYRRLFIASLAAALFIPLFYRGSNVFWFSAIFQGVFFSLIAPLSHFLIVRHRADNHHPAGAAARSLFPVLIGALMLAGQSAQAQAQDRTPELDAPVRIVVPYEGEPQLDPSANAYISRAQFERLWEAALRDPAMATELPAVATSLELTARLDPAQSQMAGELKLTAINMSDRATTAPLALRELSIGQIMSLEPGMRLESTDQGLLLHLAARTSGTLVCSFQLPAKLNGNEGSLSLDLPEVAASRWSFSLPYDDVQLIQGRAIKISGESGSVELVGVGDAGRLTLGWQVMRSSAATQESGAWRIHVHTDVVWEHLASAKWSAHVRLAALEANQSLPQTIRLDMSAPFTLSGADGESLQGVEQQNNVLILRLRPAANAEVALTGWFTPDADGNWSIPALKLPAEHAGEQSLQLAIDNALAADVIAMEGLERTAAPTNNVNSRNLSYIATSGDWQYRLDVAPRVVEYESSIHALHVPEDGFLRSVYRVEISPKGGSLTAWSMAMPDGVTVEAIDPQDNIVWFQQDRILSLRFQPVISAPISLHVFTRRNFPIDTNTFMLEPARDLGTQHSAYTLSLVVPHDRDLVERQLIEATPRAADGSDTQLLARLGLNAADFTSRLRSYRLQSASALQSFTFVSVEAGIMIEAYNLVTVREGLISLNSRFRVEPRRGRVHEVIGLLRLAAPDPNLPVRLRVTGPVRDLRTEQIDELNYRVIVELDAPRTRPFDLEFQYDQAANTDGGQTIRPLFMMPPAGAGARAWLLMRPDFTGELTLPRVDANMRAIEPDPEQWRRAGIILRPSDRCFEFNPVANPDSAFTIVRHARDEALRAIVEMLRNRCIVTIDGIERNEIEMVVQNLSEQFLRIELPYDPASIEIFEVRVAGRVVRTNLTTVAGQPVLTVPLIRTGLLDPELTIRVAYIARTGRPIKRKGRGEFQMPQILDDIPVAQSAMILMLPSEYEYSDFGGSMQRVQLLDLEIDETLRRTRKIEKISEAALVADKDVQQKAVGKLKELWASNDSQVAMMQQNNEVYSNQLLQKKGIGQGERDRLEESEIMLNRERISNLGVASGAQQQILRNYTVLQQQVEESGGADGDSAPESESQPAVQPETGASPEMTMELPDLKFPRQGLVFAFRQLQGAGHVRLKYKSERIAGNRRDLFVALGLVAFLALLTWNAGRIFSSRRGVAIFMAALGVLILWAGVIPDVGVLLLAAATVLGFWPRRRPMAAPGSTNP